MSHTLTLQAPRVLRYTAESFNVGPWSFKVWQQGHLYPVSSCVLPWDESVGDSISFAVAAAVADDIARQEVKR